MTGRTHDAFAFAALVTTAAFFPPAHLTLSTLVVSVIAADIGGMLPDVDQAGNRLWEHLPAGDRLGTIFRRVFYRHRTITHSVVGVFLIYKVLEYFLPKILNVGYIDSNIVLTSLMIGYFSHLFSDALTEDGLPLLFPMNITFGFPPIRSWRIKTGKWFENFIVFPAVWIYVLWFIHQKHEVFLKVLKSIN